MAPTTLSRHYDVAGPAEGPRIVFIHGTRLTRAVWSPQLISLSDRYRVIAVDLPGHGTAAGEVFSLDRAVDRVADVIEAEGGAPAIVVGLSLGGYVAMQLASVRPGLVRALVLSGATADPVGLRSVPYRLLGWALGRFDGIRLDRLNAWFFRTRFPADIAEPIVAHGFWNRAGSDALRAIAGRPFSTALAAYPGPTLIVNGEYDLPFRLAAPRFARAAQHPRRVRIRGATHLANLERPDVFDLAIRRFADGLASPPSPSRSSSRVGDEPGGRLAATPSPLSPDSMP